MKNTAEETFGFEPIKIVSVDITDGHVPGISRKSMTDRREYLRAMILVRLHLSPIGIMELSIPPEGISPDELASRIDVEFARQIEDHLLRDNASPSGRESASSLVASTTPRCLEDHNHLLRDAPFVSVAIATRDRIESLQECLSSVLQLDYPNFEVIVVDNAPNTDATRDMIHSNPAYSGRIRYIHEPVAGLAVAHNRALAETNAPIVAITDDDVIVDRNWLKCIVANFQRDPKIACVTGMILPQEIATLPQLWIEQFGGFGKGFQRKTFDLNENRPHDHLYPYTAGQFGSGANMAFRTSALRSIGGFDASLGAGTPAKGGDDLAIFFDVITHGYRLVYEPGAVVYHKHRPDYAGLANQAHGYGVGLSAFLTRTVMNDPRRFFEVLIKVPAGLMHMLDPRSKKNSKKVKGYPAELTRLERVGFLKGPLAYLKSRRRMSKLAKNSTADRRIIIMPANHR